MFLVNKKAELLCSLSSLRAPPSSLRIEKHEQFTHNGRKPSSLVLIDEYWRYLQSENKDYKSKYVIYVEQKRRVNNSCY